IANSYTQFVPGHVHLKPLGELVAEEIHRAGAVAKEFHTIAVDDGIAMGHEGMLYSLPSRELIADGVEYMVNAHCADALVCISNCDKITPGMLMAALRLNLPTVFVSGGPMEAGKVAGTGAIIDAVDALVAGGRREAREEELRGQERRRRRRRGCCAGLRAPPAHAPIPHPLAAASERALPCTLADIDRLSRRVPHLCKVSPSSPRYHVEDVHRAGGVMGILGELDRAGLLDTSVRNVLGETLAQT